MLSAEAAAYGGILQFQVLFFDGIHENIRDKTKKAQQTQEIQNPINFQKNNTRRVSFDANPPQRFQGGKNKTKRNQQR